MNHLAQTVAGLTDKYGKEMRREVRTTYYVLRATHPLLTPAQPSQTHKIQRTLREAAAVHQRPDLQWESVPVGYLESVDSLLALISSTADSTLAPKGGQHRFRFHIPTHPRPARSQTFNPHTRATHASGHASGHASQNSTQPNPTQPDTGAAARSVGYTEARVEGAGWPRLRRGRATIDRCRLERRPAGQRRRTQLSRYGALRSSYS